MRHHVASVVLYAALACAYLAALVMPLAPLAALFFRASQWLSEQTLRLCLVDEGDAP
jgi:hypothetical protein